MTVVIIDDEPLAIEVIESYILQVNGLELLATCTNPLDAINVLNKNKVDLIFLDIEMPNLNGLDLVRNIENLPQIIITTAYTQYALEGFELNVTDYLIKPVPFHRFLKAVARAKKNHELEIGSRKGTENETDDPQPDFIFIKAEYDRMRVNLNELAYIEGLKDYLKFHLKPSGKVLLTLSSFKEILEKLPSSKFFRVHRSFVVNIDFITAIQKTKIQVGDVRIPIGEKYKKEVYKRLNL
ncbi:MAG: LytTR family DNA-binding domain-containing protein [Salegentibacter sp.]|uniref:LytR/AlgR family response regulator transcription factor n=1 Tax=Salegentibacter sp. TaxID=1903072 RepID=UPI0028706DD5|nr:LytTR family DNA-binding domain-containing protein [Salegentibacter sp.]MDR9457627.1 LytTR family DNA-binding domain-containing protein [Salegentibacter sp.]